MFFDIRRYLNCSIILFTFYAFGGPYLPFLLFFTSKASVLLYFCTSVLLYFCTSVLLYFCTSVLPGSSSSNICVEMITNKSFTARVCLMISICYFIFTFYSTASYLSSIFLIIFLFSVYYAIRGQIYTLSAAHISSLFVLQSSS